MTIAPEELFWQLAAELQREDPRVQEGTIMNGRCLRVGQEFLALVDYKGSGLVVKLPKERVAELIDAGVGKPFGPAGKVFKEWLAVPEPDRRQWRALLDEGAAFVGQQPQSSPAPSKHRSAAARDRGGERTCAATPAPEVPTPRLDIEWLGS